MLGQLMKEPEAFGRTKFLPTQNRIDDQRGRAGRDALTQARCKMRMVAKGIPFVRPKLVEIGFQDRRIAHDDGIGGDVSQTLGVTG